MRQFECAPESAGLTFHSETTKKRKKEDETANTKQRANEPKTPPRQLKESTRIRDPVKNRHPLEYAKALGPQGAERLMFFKWALRNLGPKDATKPSGSVGCSIRQNGSLSPGHSSARSRGHLRWRSQPASNRKRSIAIQWQSDSMDTQAFYSNTVAEWLHEHASVL